ncbi:MAG TPA: YihY/virulence factor BrkB family protein [Thermomicrobiales bacterium]|nr:YihY/virulence factor BrkB family protein [Thermomicrobiales bacterium]
MEDDVNRQDAPPAISPGAKIRRTGWRRWIDVIRLSALDLFRNDGMAWAAALSFYTLLSVFPLVIGAIIAASYVTDPAWVAERVVEGVEEFVPSSQLDVATIVEGANAERRQLGLIALVVVLITGRRVLGTLVAAMNRMSDVDQQDDPLRRKILVEVGLVIGLVVLAGLAVASRPALSAVERLAGMAELEHDVLRVAVLEVTQTALILAAFLLTFYVLPHGHRSWRAAMIAAVLSTVLFLVIRALFTAAIGWLWDSFSTLYGPLTTAAFLLTWVYWAAVVVLFGASLSSHIKVMLVDGRTGNEAERAHVARSDDLSDAS